MTASTNKLCGYPLAMRNARKFCEDPAIDYMDIDVEDDGTYRVYICERHYYAVMKLWEWQVAQMLHDKLFNAVKL